MGLFTRDFKSLEDLFKHGLKDIFYAEQQIVKTLPELIKQTGSAELKRDLKKHLQESHNHVQRLEAVFAQLGEEPNGVRCKGIDGILSEGNELIGNSDGRSVIDAAIIASAQAVEHYEITRYGDLIAWAREMGRDDLIKPLQQNLREEKAADRMLTEVAEGRINKKAVKNKSRGTRRKSAPVRAHKRTVSRAAA